MNLSKNQIADIQNWETLTVENIKPGRMSIVNKQHPEWGTKAVGQDRNGYTYGSGSNSAMLDVSEFRHWAIYPA